MKAIYKAHTLMTNGDWNGQSNHERRLELQEEIKAARKQMAKSRNKRRDFYKKIREAW